MPKNTPGNRLADFVEQRLDLLTDRLLLKSKEKRQKEIRPLIHRWLSNQAACYRGTLCRMGEWITETAVFFKDSESGNNDAYRLFALCRDELIDYCLEEVEGVSERNIYKKITQASDTHNAHLAAHCVQHCQEQETAERRKTSMIMEAVVSPLALLNTQGFIEAANQSLARSLGVTPGSLVGRDMLIFCDSKTVTRMRSALRHKTAGKRPRPFAGVLQNGEKKMNARFTAQPLFDSTGARSGVALCMETEVMTSNVVTGSPGNVANDLLTTLPFPVQMFREKGKVTYSSDAVKTIVQDEYTEQEPLCCFLYRHAYGEQRPCPCRDVFTTGQFHMGEFCYSDAEETRWYMLILIPVSEKSGRITQVISCVYDMTLRRRIQKQLESEIIVQQRSSLMSQIAVTVAHQLRNPLSVVLGFSEMLAKGMPPKQAVDAGEHILRNAARCKDIVEKLLTFGKSMPHEWRTLDISLLVRESVRPLLTPTQKRIITWNLTEKPVPIECIPEQLAQMIFSLLDNALYFAESRVLCSLKIKRNTVQLRIVDDGPGISSEMEEEIFEPFVTTRRDSGAVGLGLSLARAVANDYGGSLTISKAVRGEPAGACFVLQLPVLKLTDTDLPVTKKKTPESLAARRLLIVDDEADLLNLMKTGLYMHGYLVDAVASGVEALEKLSGNTYDAAIVDFHLSGSVSGAAVYEHIKEKFPKLEKRTLFITGDTMKYQTRLFLENSGRPVLEKPFLMADLLINLQQMEVL
ncbi:MAG: response regulator [Candidatus Hydrogenedentes bacterium]|nr:response regulator [Candidatus Hydrogenedentota bacterium]